MLIRAEYIVRKCIPTSSEHNSCLASTRDPNGEAGTLRAFTLRHITRAAGQAAAYFFWAFFLPAALDAGAAAATASDTASASASSVGLRFVRRPRPSSSAGAASAASSSGSSAAATTCGAAPLGPAPPLRVQEYFYDTVFAKYD